MNSFNILKPSTPAEILNIFQQSLLYFMQLTAQKPHLLTRPLCVFCPRLCPDLQMVLLGNLSIVQSGTLMETVTFLLYYLLKAAAFPPTFLPGAQCTFRDKNIWMIPYWNWEMFFILFLGQFLVPTQHVGTKHTFPEEISKRAGEANYTIPTFPLCLDDWISSHHFTIYKSLFYQRTTNLLVCKQLLLWIVQLSRLGEKQES